MKLLNVVLFSYTFVIALPIILGAGVTTFIDNDYYTQTVKAVIYNACWYGAVMLLLAVSLIGIIIKNRMYRKLGTFLFQVGFVLIEVAVTRYFGYESMISIREGQLV